MHVSFPVSELAVTPGDIEATGPPQVELGSYQVQITSSAKCPASCADFTIHR